MAEIKKFDLEERTAKFAERSIEFVKRLPKNLITTPLIDQYVRSSTSIGSNYCEANCAESRKDFEHKIGICKKESRESKYWLQIIAKAVPEMADEARVLWKEANELNLIFTSIVRKSKSNEK